MDKKGSTRAILMLFCVLAGILVATQLFGTAKMAAKDTKSIATYFAVDTAYLINTLYSAPDSVRITYPFELENTFRMKISEGNVTLVRRFIFKDNKTTKLFGHNYLTALKYEPVSGKITFTKKPSELIIKANEEITLKQLRCIEDAPAKKIGESTIVIDPAYQDAAKAERTLALSTFLKTAGITSVFYDTTFTRLDDTEITLEERLEFIATDTDVVLSFEIGSHPDSEISYVKAYIPFDSDESQRLACTILNLMTDKIPGIDGISIIPTASKEILKKNKGNTAVLFEIGNINQLRQTNMLYQNLNKLSNSIKEGTKAHYGVS